MTLFGPDGSHHQDGMAVAVDDWAAIDFLLWRSSIGVRTDRTFKTFETAARSRRVAFSAYHFVYPCGRYPAVEQARTFSNAVAADRTIPVMLDWESDGTLAATFDDVLAVAAEIRELGFRVPLLYTGRWYWQSKGRPTLAGHGFDLVNANYGNQKPTGTYTAPARYVELGGDTSVRWAGYGGLDPVVWQFGSRIRWGDRWMDHNACRHPRSALARWFWTPMPEPVPPPPTLEDDMAWIVAKNAGNGNSWEASPDGRSRLQMPDQVDTAVVFARPAWDPFAERWVTDIDQVQPVSAAQVTAKLGPRAR